MRVKSMRLRYFRSFVDSDVVGLGPINVLIGANNSGKSSVLRALHQLQHGLSDTFGDVRVGNKMAHIDINLSHVSQVTSWPGKRPPYDATLSITISSSDRRSGDWQGKLIVNGDSLLNGDTRLANVEPHHFIVPYFSKRKAVQYSEDIREVAVMTVLPDVSTLAAKLSRLANPAFPNYSIYGEACKSILGFVVTAIPSQNGQRPGIYLPDQSTIPIEQMGEGVPNIVQLLVSLATSQGKLFLIEEPENDLHPIALKALLDLIIASSSSNQFVISTHSNIVVRHLCSTSESQLLKVSSLPGVLPTEAKIEPVPKTPEARIAVLQELGYTFWDFDLWEGWLILEESSAERIIHDYLIPWFTPKLSRIRTISANGIDRVEPVLDDFLRLVIFTHLQPAYANRTWVRVDGDARGKSLASSLSEKYSQWPKDRFSTFSAENFELYYPAVFVDEARTALSVHDPQERRAAKRTLLVQVAKWLDDDPERGKSALKESAASVIDDLKAIELQLLR